ncbi:hypothetical protein MTO96_034578 [Rhipicephalus appendiculatus]
MCGADVFDSDSEHLRTSCKTLSDTIEKDKEHPLRRRPRLLLRMCLVVRRHVSPLRRAGTQSRTEPLASGGQHAHGLVLDSDMDSDGILGRIHNLVRYKPGRVCDNRQFEEWLRSCEWQRSRSSSIGRVEYEIEVDGERRRGHFKARKNLVLDAFTFDDLVTRVRQHDTQENKALVKSEFGKVRLAVSAP